MNIGRLYRTIKHLTLTQIVYQIIFRIYSKKTLTDYHLRTIPNNKLSVDAIAKYDCLSNGKFNFLNITNNFSDWNNTQHGMLWAYNLNYMDWLNQKEISENDGIKWIDEFIAHLDKNTVGLDPYPTALRCINWIKFFSKYPDSISLKRVNSLYSQCKLLARNLEYHLLGNHVLEDAYSLYICSIFFNDTKLYEKSYKILQEQLSEQILDDGAHFEQSVMYHCILLDRLLDCINISTSNIFINRQNQDNLFLKDMGIKMLGHLDEIIFDDGNIPLLNDSAYNIAPTAQQLFEYAKKLKINWQPLKLSESGYRKLRNSKFEVIVDLGKITATYQPGHSHADGLSYILKIAGKLFIVDTGTSTYNKTDRRQYERSTAAHNTVMIDNKDSDEVWGGFRVGYRSNTKISSITPNYISATLTGFGSNLKHNRVFKITADSFTVEDTISSQHTGVSFIHLAPEIKEIHVINNTIYTNNHIIHTKNAKFIKITDNTVSSQYNQFEKIKVIELHFNDFVQYSIQ